MGTIRKLHKIHKIPTKDDALTVANVMVRSYNVPIIYKPTAAEMKIVAGALEAFGVLKANDFLTRFSTYIFGRVYLPFKVTDAPGAVAIMSLAHEYGHAYQDNRAGPGLEWELDYCDPMRRAVLEAECYAIGACLAVRYPYSFTPAGQQVSAADASFRSSYGSMPEQAKRRFLSELESRVKQYRLDQRPFNLHLHRVCGILDGRLVRR